MDDCFEFDAELKARGEHPVLAKAAADVYSEGMLRQRKFWGGLLIIVCLSTIASIVTYLQQPPAKPGPCPEALRAHNRQLGTTLRKTTQVTDWLEGPAARGEWVIVSYTVNAKGELSGAKLLESSGKSSDSRIIVDGVNAAAPIDPLPKGLRSLKVTELFWTRSRAHFQEGSLGAQLNELSDGRWIR